MQAALIRIGEPPHTWCRALSQRFPRIEAQVISLTSQPGRSCTETVILRGPRLDDVGPFLMEHPHVRSHEIIGQEDAELQVRLHLGACPVADTIPLHGVAPRLPFRTRDGHDLWFLIGPADAVEQAWTRLRDDGHSAEVIRRATWPGIGSRLTEKQRRVLTTAVLAGYYDYPRKITLSALAERLGVAKSTLSESLMVIEKKVMGQYNDETASDGDRDRPQNPIAL